MLKTALACLLLVAPAAAQFPQTCPQGMTLHFPGTASTAIDSCGIAGAADPKSAEGLQNAQKNNFCIKSDVTATPIGVVKATALEKSAEAGEKKLKFKPGMPPPDRSFLTALGEGQLVVFEGYVFEARQECSESVNCSFTSANVDASHDIHISILDNPRKTKPTDPKPARDGEECGGMVAEMTPHHRPLEWSACNVSDVAAKGLRVRVTGQQLFDGSHVPCKNGKPVGTDPKRVSLWEIHPIYAFEVCPSGDCKAGGWVPLEKFEAGKTECKTEPCTAPESKKQE